MPYWQCFYHVVFATISRQPLLTPALRATACRLISQKVEALGCVLHAVHAQPDHVHIVLSVPPSIAAAFAIGQIKGSSSHALAVLSAPSAAFAWQGDYGVLTFGRSHLGNVVGYVNDQDRRHANADLVPELERMSTVEDGPADPRQPA